MIKRLFDKIAAAFAGDDETGNDGLDHETALGMATAVLMIDIAQADDDLDQSEFDRIRRLVETRFGFSPEQAAEVLEAASEKADELVSVHEFTKVLHQHLDEEEKARIVGMLWEIAYADGNLNKYEDALVLKIGDLLYVSRGRVMRLKHDAEQAYAR
ncbi:MAG: TerB family tellurite resistance protein [Woeseiaceae bacterium]|nr:TerB family tellurite resistance protein [Woeseiaceae bacterium]